MFPSYILHTVYIYIHFILCFYWQQYHVLCWPLTSNRPGHMFQLWLAGELRHLQYGRYALGTKTPTHVNITHTAPGGETRRPCGESPGNAEETIFLWNDAGDVRRSLDGGWCQREEQQCDRQLQFFFFFIIILGSTASWFVLKWTSVTPTELILVKLLYAVHFKWRWPPLRWKEWGLAFKMWEGECVSVKK